MTHLSDQVLEKLDSYIGSFIAFTSFAQASTDNTIIKCSVKRKGDKCDRGQKYMLSIRLCQTNLEEEYDYGYWVDTELERIDEDNVIFNIYNLF